jgi:HlyD family secretion protein
VSQDAVDQALNTQQQAQAQVEVDRAVIQQREAELQTARVNLEYTDIISPVDGTVVSRNVTVGQTVAAAFQTPTLFLIATDLTRMQVDANVTEAAIGEVSEGQKATFTVEAFPDRVFTGLVTQVRQAPVSVQNVISYDVVIEIDNSDRLFKPGMTATAHIVLAERDDVMRVPESALRFTPTALTAEHADTNRHQETAVWVIRSGGLMRIPVTLGVRGENDVEVTSGAFEPDDRVVIGRERAGGSVAAADRTQIPAQRR